ncbi:uncharacterized protein LOC125940408 [Dermacentor silvarum]|uniref:uncharacterized protein LOC125940338 n=2 Tax=Dermacentor silvarum TaxID=543639 RepID=UPI002101A653|nr:uncharacterized protein LOC125940338 [Dermacentor silvarum]XP_049512487.1 uncharacterized protein LOC125940408 [Dermacentor silvarum]
MKASPVKWIARHLNPRFSGSMSTRHGQISEPKARRWYEQLKATKVQEVGLVVRPETSWLGASPDGVIADSPTIIEIKCPTPQTLEKHGSLKELFNSGQYDVISVDGTLSLSKKGKNKYYFQVQLQMYCCQKERCDFVVWSPGEAYVVEVLYDKEFLETYVPQLEHFYFAHLLPALTDRAQ